MSSSEYIHVTLDERQIALKDMETSHLLNLRRVLKKTHKLTRERLDESQESVAEGREMYLEECKQARLAGEEPPQVDGSCWICLTCDYEALTLQPVCPVCGEEDFHYLARRRANVQLRAVNKELRRRRAASSGQERTPRAPSSFQPVQKLHHLSIKPSRSSR